MLKLARLALCLSIAGCGPDDAAHADAAQAADDAIATAVGVLMVQKQPAADMPPEDEVFCSGTLIAPDVVLTSARCARVATTSRVTFGADLHDGGEPVLVRAATMSLDAPAAPCATVADPYGDAADRHDDAEAPGAGSEAAEGNEDAAGSAPPDMPTWLLQRTMACRDLRARCGGLHDISAPDAPTLACLHMQPPELLRQAGFFGFGPGHDLALLFLEHAVTQKPATLAGEHVQQSYVAPPRGTARSVSFVRAAAAAAEMAAPDAPAGLKTASLAHVARVDDRHTLMQAQAAELLINATSGRDATDRGGALFVGRDATAKVAAGWYLTAVASRPVVTGADTNTGMIYARIDAPALQWIEGHLAQACRDGRRSDCHLRAGIATAPRAAAPPSCRHGAPGWVVPVMLAAWAIRRAGRSRRGARARLMYGWLVCAMVAGTAACGEMSTEADLLSGDNVIRQSIVHGTPARDRYLAVGALVRPGNRGYDPYTVQCTGTLIADDVVLTAAHCLTAGAQHFREVGHVVPKLLFRPGAQVGHGNLVGTTQVRHMAVHPAYLHAAFANGGPHNTFCPEGDSRLDRVAACERLQRLCQAADVATLSAVVLDDPKSEPWERVAKSELRECVNRQDEALLRTAGYVGVQDDHDIALVVLESPVPNARPARLPTAGDTAKLLQGTTLLGVGYGEQATQAQPPKRGEKRFMRNTLTELGQWEIRLGVGPPQACYADSGGPLFFADAEAHPTVLGVVSRLADSRSIRCDRGAIYARVDRDMPWIDQTMRALCEQGVREGCKPRAHTMAVPEPEQAPDVAAPQADGCQVASAPAAVLAALAAWVGVRLRRRVD